MTTRATSFAFVLYPESTSEKSMIDFLNDLHVPHAISPLHDMDQYDDGSNKKPHWHCLLKFPSLKAPKQVQDLLSPIGVDYVEIVHDLHAYTRYLAHLDSSDKYQYKQSEIKLFDGFNTDYLLPPGISSSLDATMHVSDFVIEHNICEFKDLVSWAISELDYDVLEYARKNSYYLVHLISSIRHAGS